MNYCEHPEGTAQMLRHMADIMETKSFCREDKNTIKIELCDSDGENIGMAILAELNQIAHMIDCIG